MSFNPDFRSWNLDSIKPGPQGWTDGMISEKEALDLERREFANLEDDMPCAVRRREPRDAMPEMLEKWNRFQESKGRFPGSADWSLLDEFVHGQPIVWLPQIIGSCVVSNTKGAYTIRMMYEITLLGQLEKFLGRHEFGPDNFTFYGPQTYGCARKRGDMRRGDGLYCSVMAESLMKDGVLPCSTPALIELAERLGVAGENDFPEPQNARVYRAFGSWEYIEELRPYMDFPVLECPAVNTADELWSLLADGKPCFVCSSEAIHKIDTHPDGFAIHARDPVRNWSHNMGVHGCFVASDGARFFRWSNESWGPGHIYNRRFEEVEAVLRSGRLEMRAIGEISGPIVSPPRLEL